MNKSELVKYVAEKYGYSKKEVEEIMNSILDVIKEQISNGNEVKFTGFGSFKVKTRKQRKGRNPQTGEELIIPEHKVPVFKFSHSVKEQVNNDFFIE